jgi:hypothetical protein
MTPEPKSSPAAPYGWVGCVVLMPNEVEDLLHAIPEKSPLSDQLRDTAEAVSNLAARLNNIDRPGRNQ